MFNCAEHFITALFQSAQQKKREGAVTTKMSKAACCLVLFGGGDVRCVIPPSAPTVPVSYSSSASFSCSSTTLAKLLALEDDRERSWASGMDGALQHITKLHT